MASTPSYTVSIECGSDNDYDGRLGLRISSIFVIGFGSMLGALLPIAAARSSKMNVHPLTFFVMKYFGSGIIIATAFIHLLAPAVEALGSPCLTGRITGYTWPEGIAMMTIFTMLFVELLAVHLKVYGGESQRMECCGPAPSLVRSPGKQQHHVSNDNHTTVPNGTAGPETATTRTRAHTLAASDNLSPMHTSGPSPSLANPSGDDNHLAYQCEPIKQMDKAHFAAQMTTLFILEFGLIFHSIFIGLALAVSGDEFTVLYIVLTFHQTFEGVGLGSRLATAQWPDSKRWMPWLLGSAYALTTPIAIAVGLAVKQSFAPGSQSTLIVNGVFDSISAGILLYTGLVELMAHEFLISQEMRSASLSKVMFAFGCMAFGAGIMALLGKWA